MFGCDRWGKYDASKALKVNPELRSARIEVPKGNELLPLRLKWKVVIKEDHNHDPSSEPTSHLPPARRYCQLVGIVEANGDTLRLRNMYACQYGSSSTRGHGRQGDFKGPVQHESEGQKCSTWTAVWFCRFEQRRISSLRVAKRFAGGACLALMLIFSCVVSTLPRISLDLAKSSLELEKPFTTSLLKIVVLEYRNPNWKQLLNREASIIQNIGIGRP